MTLKQRIIARKMAYYLTAAVAVGMFGQNCSNGFQPIDYLDHFSSSSTSTTAEFLAAKTIVQNRCTSCHSSSGQASSFPLNFSNEQQFISFGYVLAGQPDQSKLIQRLKNFTGTTSLQKNMPINDTLPDSEYQTLRRWIMALGSVGPGSTNPYTCNDNDPLDSKVVVSKLQVLTKLQYTNTIKDFLVLTLPTSANAIYTKVISSAILPDDASARYPRTLADLSKEKLDAYFKVADQLGTEIMSSTTGPTFLSKMISLNAGLCAGASLTSLNNECQKQFIRNLGLRLYRRPLTEIIGNDEVETFRKEFDITADRSIAISNLIFRMMMSQNFLFKMEDHEVESPIDPKLLQLSSYSVANRLSYTFWNSMPDEQLLAMAANANLQDDIKFVEAMNYVLSSNKVDSSLKEFAYGWLLLKKTPNFDPNTTSLKYFNDGITFDSNMKTAMNDEAQELVSYITRSDGKLSDIFTTDISFTRYTPLMQVYGVSSPAPTQISSTNLVRMPAGTRSGILTRAALLSEASGGQHLIHRAVRIKRDLLCISQPPPPADVTPPVAITDTEFPTMTFRQRFAHDTSSGTCFSCHQTINPWGYSLSKFNGLGFYKQTEPAFTKDGMLTGTQLPLDSTTDMTGVASGAGQFNDAFEFSNFVSSRPETQSCFATNYATYFLGRAPSTTTEGCRLNKMIRVIKSGSVKDAMSSIATDIEFRHKKID